MRYFRTISSHLWRVDQSIARNPNFNPKSIQNHVIVGLAQSKFLLNFNRNCASLGELKPNPSPNVSAIVDEISGLTLLEVADLTEVLREKLDVKEMPTMAVMMPGMGFGAMKGGPKGGAAGKREEKVEKTVFDVKLEEFPASEKIKVIKEVRAFTGLGLKEAKDLVEKAPTMLKKGATKEEAEKIIEKMKAVGAKATME